MHRFFKPLPDANNKRVTLSKKTKKKLKNEFGNYTANFTHQISLISTLPYVAKDSLGKDKNATSWMLYPFCLLCMAILLNMG
jgi:hypothetical protein